MSAKILGLIPARGGSKGLPGKNSRPLLGTPLIEWTIRSALKAPELSRTIVSSDDPGLIEIARAAGCEAPFVRPSHLATDQASSTEVALHALEQLQGYDFLALLQPTSPFRTSEDISGAVKLLLREGASSLVSVTETAQHPYWTFFRSASGQLIPCHENGLQFTRRQELPPAYALNGAIYLVSTSQLKSSGKFVDAQTLAYVMPVERSLDIDTLQDFEYAEYLGKRDRLKAGT